MPALTFTQIRAAVKPKERTDQYHILAALYCVGAADSAVATKLVNDLLKLHLGKQVPSNVTTRLVEYTAYVEPVSKGPPRTWKLTGAGLERLRTLSGLAFAADKPTHDYDFDVGIVCALEQPEQEAVLRAFGGEDNWQNAGDSRFPHVYRKAELRTAAGHALRIVSTTATSMGLTAAAIATSHLVMQFRPRLVIMPGIAAGTRSGDKRFGDVLVADPSVDYNSGKVVDNGGISAFQPDPYPIGLHPRLRSVLHKYKAPHKVFEQIRTSWKHPLPPGPNRLHIGPVGAADQVIDDANRILEITKNWRKLIGVEMETYGVYRACSEAPEPKPRFLSFKAVCDFAAEKADSWQPYAAFVAAEFTATFLRLDWEALWPQPSTQEHN